MPPDIQENLFKILDFLYRRQKEVKDEIYVSGEEIRKATGLSESQINDAVELLHESGLVEWYQTLGTAPYMFNLVLITARGKYEVEKRRVQARDQIVRPSTPVGSPYGFTEVDWQVVSARKAQRQVLHVVLGCKFVSSFYDTDKLKNNIKEMFDQSINRYNKENPDQSVVLNFISLHAGYGEHLFNAIARDIISSDIAVFETSDLAPNVFIEIGVALTWGSKVFLVKKEGCPSPPSDISGQTYADYVEDARKFLDGDYSEKLYRMVEQAIRKKG